jgi:hypothetical protein
MTLREKLFNTIEFKTENVVPECEKIAEDFAIRFLEFVHVNCEEDWGSDNYLYDEESYTIRELLEVFKKERNL